MRVLVFLNGELRDTARIKKFARRADFIVAADGGARHAKRLGVEPDVVIGDLDSLPRPLPRWPDTAYILDDDKDRSDCDKALAYLLDMETTRVWIAGALGGRLDHQMVNMALLEGWSGRLPIEIVDNGSAVCVKKGLHRFSTRKGEPVTLLPVTQNAVISTQGLLYPLKRQRLARGSQGLSNQALGRRADIRIHQGKTWILRPLAT